mgnify:FL=1
MYAPTIIDLEFTNSDIEFLVDIVLPLYEDRDLIRSAIREDQNLRDSIVSDIRVFRHIQQDDGILLKISPRLYFEVLLRKAHQTMSSNIYTFEILGKESIPVFDSSNVFEYLKTPKILEYLAHMLSSFTKIQSFVIPVRTGRGIRRRIRFNDMDLDSLIKFAATVDEGERFHYYKRIGDVCLFLNGFFQNHTHSVLKIPGLVDGSKRMKRSYEDYETEGRRFYGLAEKHDTAARMELQTIFSSLKNNFTTAKKPLQFISLYYLNSKKFELFGYQG